MNQELTLDSLSKEQIINEPLPLDLLLQNSVYYPACDLDGGVIKYCNTRARNWRIQSFVYCDYMMEEDIEVESIHKHIRGYSVFAHRKVTERELNPTGKSLGRAPFRITKSEMEEMIHWSSKHEPFCHWFVLERKEGWGESHGPRRFSLLYLCSEGVATYMQLYNTNFSAPTAVAIIQPGHAFGCNWTNFTLENAPLCCVMRMNPAGMPRIIFYGGYWNRKSDWGYSLDWEGYHEIDRIHDYYKPGEGLVTINIFDQ